MSRPFKAYKKFPIPKTLLVLLLLLSACLPAISSQRASAHARLQRASGRTAVTTYHNDNARSGQNLNETQLTTYNVNAQHFGLRVSYPVDGQVYAQPLFVPDLSIHGQTYDVVYVATENDSVYAFDADASTITAPLWQTSFIHPPAITTVSSNDLYGNGNQDLSPQAGITSTPVIDLSTSTLYTVAMTREGTKYVQRLHALDLASGSEKPGSPLEIQASAPGRATDSRNGYVNFSEKLNNQRPALLLLNGIVYISWSSFGDNGHYHGWLIGYSYDGNHLQQVRNAVYSDTPDGEKGGIWMSGAGPSADNNGNLYLTTGNGSFDLNNAGPDAGDSFLKFSTRNGLQLTDYFTPFNQSCLSANDTDLGSSEPLLLPDQTGTNHPHLMLGMGKEGRIYLLDRDNLGHYTNDPHLNCGGSEETRTDLDAIVQELPKRLTGPLYGSMSYWGGTGNSGQFVYMGGRNDSLHAFQLNNGLLRTHSFSQTPETFGFPGVTPSLTSNNNADGSAILWINSPSTCTKAGCNGYGTLRAYDATDLNHELYNSEQNSSRDRVDSYVKFTVPTIANGHAFVGTQGRLSIYGLLTPSQAQFTTVDDSIQGQHLDQFNYIGNWGHCTDCSQHEGMYNASNSWSSSINATMTFSFTGSVALVYGVERSFHGIGALSIDGGSETLIDFYAPTSSGDQLLWISPQLPPGPHILALRVTGTKNPASSNTLISVDCIKILS